MTRFLDAYLTEDDYDLMIDHSSLAEREAEMIVEQFWPCDPDASDAFEPDWAVAAERVRREEAERDEQLRDENQGSF